MANRSQQFQTSHGALSEVAQDQFMRMVPTIRRVASLAFRGQSWIERQEFVSEVMANALVAFSRLVARGKAELAYANPLARYGVRQVRDGRKVGTPQNVDDVSSDFCRRRRRIHMLSLQQGDRSHGSWQELVLNDRRASPSELAITRLDMAAWLGRLSPFQRDVAEFLAVGERTSNAAQRFQVTAGRISQLRKELQASWDQFQNGLVASRAKAMTGRSTAETKTPRRD